MTMKTGVVLLNFGEPEHAIPGEVIPFLERIFALNAPLMGHPTPEQVRARSRALAEARAPGLIREYETIGGSPLHAQSREQAELLEAELRRRGHDATVLLGFQFTRPSIAEAVERAREARVERLVGLPVYPLCGPTTTIAALQELDAEVRARDWKVELREITGWHRHPGYLRLRADAILSLLGERGLSLADPETKLVFSAHGTPLKYLEGGSRYDLYVQDFCASLAEAVDAPDYALGYQNHTNRPGVEWTQPDVGHVIEEIEARRVVVDPVSFMHEQSETLAELDHELRGEAEARGLEFHRVPIPYAAPAFIDVLADLVEGGVELRRCRCREGAWCLNG
jgi:ferrochelatase